MDSSRMNKCALIVDGNWLLMSRASIMIDKFSMTNSESARSHATDSLQTWMAKSISVTLNRLPVVDNIIIVTDGGSWRKHIERPVGAPDYKGNRSLDDTYDWHAIFNSINNLKNAASEHNITVSNAEDCEGDDWAWFWSRKLNNNGVNCIIWSIDNDLKQLVQQDVNTNTFTAWWNEKNGVWFNESMKPIEYQDDTEFFMAPISVPHTIFENLRTQALTENYIDPNQIILTKIFTGDSGDNVKSIVSYEKNGRTYKFSQSDFNKLQEVFHLKNVDDVLKQRKTIAEHIASLKKYKKYNIDPQLVSEMIVFNTRVVWLHSRTIPRQQKEEMYKCEYKQFDISEIRNNYKILGPKTEEDNIIEKLFES